MADTFQAVQFNSSREVISSDGQALNREIIKDNVTSNAPGVRVNVGAGSAFRMSIGPDGNATPISESPSTASVNMGSILNGEQGILSSLNRGGSVIAASEALPSDLVTLPGGITTTLENATRLGFVRNDKLHGYVNASEPQLREADGTGERERAQAAAQAAQAEAESTAKINAHPVPEIEEAHSGS